MAVGAVRPVVPVVQEEQDYPIDLENAERDAGLAQWAVRVHQPQDWPHGRFCVNDRARWPCPLYRWGFRVLLAAGWSEAAVEAYATGSGPPPAGTR